MTGFGAFVRKEVLEALRTYKLLIMLSVFIIFGITNPLMAKLMPEIFESVMSDEFSIVIPPPTALDSWTQFFKNATQIGLIVTVIVFSGTLASELQKGTLIPLLTKGMSRAAVILAKYAVILSIWTVSLILCFLLTWGYTVYLFPDGNTENLFFSVFCLWLFGLFLLSALIFASTITKNTFGTLLIVGGVIVVCFLIRIIPEAQKYVPTSLASENMGLINGIIEPSFLEYSVAITFLLSAIFVLLAVLVFRKKQV